MNNVYLVQVEHILQKHNAMGNYVYIKHKQIHHLTKKMSNLNGKMMKNSIMMVLSA